MMQFNPQRLEAIASCKVINIFYSIQVIVRKYRFQLCYCYEGSLCKACQISSYYKCDFYKCLARKNFKTLVNGFMNLISYKNELINKAGYKIIFLNDYNELLFFGSKLPKITDKYCTADEILF